MANINLEANTAQIREERDVTPGGPQQAPAPEQAVTRDFSGDLTGNNRLFVLGPVSDDISVKVNGDELPNDESTYAVTKNEAGTTILSFHNPLPAGTKLEVTTTPAQPAETQPVQPAQQSEQVPTDQPAPQTTEPAGQPAPQPAPGPNEAQGQPAQR